MRRTRIKICGLTREADVEHAAAAGADAIGFVLYPASPRHVSARRAGELARRLPVFVTPVLLFVNASADAVAAALDAVPHAMLQFHGDESPEQCAALAGTRPWLRAARVPLGAGAAGFDLLEYAERYAAARAVLIDAQVPGYGGGGQTFDWTAFPWSHPRLNAADRVVLSGGLTPANVTDGVRRVRPWAVDVSSGVEAAKGIKDPARVEAFIAAVRRADLMPADPSPP
ncbi:N-(5'-phosphoribosyl)anthranilate isomerase [Tepidimonas thermarum]|uniref:N-(5'-phosphoribosyl)anthranilate isomerase n=1 Tax=Tepidimonas thermarum TaxID=335431 RepID=A0A554X752_9BURK|nr:phosphoribosylanthranilate isomerase [Tepidimonas thermarum]TSE31647.1 N-(5'-phosphoribosyl)anthranilate isomerase [Tepidimonas thermarum]